MVKIQNSNLSRIIGIIRPILFFITLALAIAWIYGVPNVEPWTYLFGLIVALLEGVSLIQQFKPDPQSRQARQLEALSFSLKQYPGVLSYVETLVKTGETTDTALSKILKTTPRFVLTGVSGSGKTTALCKTALTITQEALEGLDQQRKSAPVPFVVYFSQWQVGQSLKDFLQKQWPYEGDAIEVIAKSNIYFLGDGLDELPKDAPTKIEELNRWLSSGIGPYRAFFTCRIPHYYDGLQLALPSVEIPDELSDAQIKEFSDQYLGKEKASTFLSAFYAIPAQWAYEDIFSTFMKTPLFLTILLQNYIHAPANSIVHSPGERVDLYIRTLWQREQDRHSTKTIPFNLMTGACAYLAHEANFLKISGSYSDRDQNFDKQFAINSLASGLVRFSNSHRNKLNKQISLLILRPFVFLQSVLNIAFRISRIGSFILSKYARGTDSDINTKYILSYLTADWPDAEFWKAFPEYHYVFPFGPEFWMWKKQATVILNDLVNARILRLTEGNYDFSYELLLYAFRSQNDFIEGATDDLNKLGGHRLNWTRADYRDDIRTLLLANLAHDKNDFIAKLSEHDPYVAAKCVENGVEVNYFVKEKIFDDLLKQLKQTDHDWLVVETVTALNSLADPSIVEDLLDVVASNSFPPLIDAIIDAVVSLKKDAVPSLINNLISCDSKVASVIIRSLGRISDPRAIQPLEQWSQNNQENYYYLWALAALSHMGHKPSKHIYFDQHLCYPPKRESHFDISSYCQAWTAFCETAPNHSIAFQELLDVLLSTVNKPDEDVSFIRNCFYRTLRFRHMLDESINSELLEAYMKTDDIEIRRILVKVLTERNVTQVGETLAKDIYDPNLASDIIDAVGKLNINTPAVIKALMGYLGHPKAYIRHAAIRALGDMEILDAALPISKMLTDTENVGLGSQTTAELAAETLLKLNTPISKDKAADYYIALLQKANYDSGEWHSAEIKLDQIDTPKAYAAIEKERTRRHSKETDS